MPKTNERLEELLEEWAELLGITGTDPFRIRAYEKAARAVGGYSKDLRGLDDKAILAIPNVGKNMAARIREYLDTGTMHELEDLRELVPGGMRELLRLPGLGPKKAMLLHDELGISSIPELHDAVTAHKVRSVKGLGLKTEENIASALERYTTRDERILINQAADIATDVIDALRDGCAFEDIAFAGSLRRMRDTIGDIDILVAASDAAPIMAFFTGLDRVEQVIAHGDTKSSIRTDRGVQVDLRVIPVDAWGAALIYFTGSKAHNVKIRQLAIRKGLKLSEWGLFKADSGDVVAARTEEEVYDALGLPWIPPPMREDNGEIEAALAGTIPDVVTRADLRGDLHTHTNLTDGLAPMEEMIAAGAAAGYRYMAITDHAENLSMTGMTRAKALAQRKQIAALQARYPKMTLLHGCELNIGRDGSVDYDPDFLAGFDILVASVHSLFRLSREETTKRLLTAIENPLVNVIGHPSGRQIGRRDPIDFDVEQVCAAAARTGTALEVNSFPDRLDLRDDHVRWAIERGVTIAVDTDAHAPKHFGNLRFGVGTAQRGWATKRSVLNARTEKQVREFVAKKRKRA